MKLIIQIPCYNEENTLGITLDSLPRKLKGIDKLEWLVIDDGSTDKTLEVAEKFKTDHIISFKNNRGLAKAFMAGLEHSVKAGADIIVNIDADNQYSAENIPDLIQPIIDNKCDIVIGARPIEDIEHFSKYKKIFQRIGSWVVRMASNTDIPDAPSGFRAISREAALRLNVFNEYTYTLEMVIQAGLKGIPMMSVPVKTNPPLRSSRLIKNLYDYVIKSAMTIILIFMTYRPLKFFFLTGLVPFLLGLIFSIRWLLLYFGGPQASSIPSLIFSSVMIIIGFQLWMFGLIAELMAVNRKLSEEQQYRIRTQEWKMQDLDTG